MRKQRSFLSFFFAVSRFKEFVVVRLRSVCDVICLHLRQEKNKQVLSVLALTASTAADAESMTNASQPVSHQSIQKYNSMASEVILQNKDEKGQKSTAKLPRKRDPSKESFISGLAHQDPAVVGQARQPSSPVADN